MKLWPVRIGLLIWLLIYGGLIAASLGLAIQREAGGDALGWSVAVAGAAAVAVGIVLVWVRSRIDTAH